MSEKEETQEIQEASEGQSEETSASLVGETRQLVKQLREENDRMEDLIAKKMLGGRSEAGEKPKKETDDERWAREAKERYAGSGLDPTDDDTPVIYG